MSQYNITHSRFTNVPTNRLQPLEARSSALALLVAIASSVALRDLGVKLLLLFGR